ncbi:hypothetical protein [Endozoicomonas elysicola]|uniref:Uncharacterized protein n=1 Tax=Endozoicomonas elysicola TaxID=305900 RepID=A0A081K8R9_9GAMM|nr:hypothetical protein [Endozoicomonas elysicola]KEI70545.1 hypothetical protein GV64_07150 [Endozoicomonas elysicola]
MDSEKTNIEEQLKAVEKKLMLTQLADAPAMIVIGLGMFAKFGESPESLHPWLGNTLIVDSSLAVAIPVAIFCAFQSFRLMKKVNALKKQLHG